MKKEVDLRSLSIRELRKLLLADDRLPDPQTFRCLENDDRKGVSLLVNQLRRKHAAHQKERHRIKVLSQIENRLWESGIQHICGVDEAGMGPLAGPIVAAAVILPPGTSIQGVDDSKRLTEGRRETLAEEILKTATAYSIGISDVEEINRLNVYQAGLLAMKKSVDGLAIQPQHLLVDARTIPSVDVPQSSYVRGDQRSFSIASASIIAKTYRDKLMREADDSYPEYGFAIHKGYATAIHREAIAAHGLCPIHRKSYAALSDFSGSFSTLFYELRQGISASKDSMQLDQMEVALRAAKASMLPSEFRRIRAAVLSRRKLFNRLEDEACTSQLRLFSK